MNKDELSKATRRFTAVVEGLNFKALSFQHIDPEKGTKVGGKSYEVRQGPTPLLSVLSEEEAERVAARLNSLVEPFLKEEFELLKWKLEE